MKAITLLKALNRMCSAHDSCDNCPVVEKFNGCPVNYAPYRQNPETYPKLIEVVEAWVKENPSKTRGTLFFDRNPDAKRCKTYPNVPDVRPCDYDESVNYPAHWCCEDTCDDCRKKYWEEPVE